MSYYFPRLGLVVMWLGWSGWTARYRWGIVGGRWRTFYAGPIKLVTGPRV